MSQTLPQCSHITRKRGLYYWRKRLPRPLPGEVAISLRTRHFREAEHRAAILDRAFREALNKAMDQSTGKLADLNAILREYLNEQLDGDRPGSVPLALHPLAALEDYLSDTLRDLQNRDPRRLAHVVAELMARHGLPEAERDRLGLGLLEAEVSLYRRAIRRAKGEESAVFVEEDPVASPAPRPVSPATASPAREEADQVPTADAPAAPPKTPLASSLFEDFIAHRRTVEAKTEQVLAQERDTLRLFADICGDRPLDAYKRADISHFHATMRRLPSKRGRSPADRELTAADFIARAEASGESRITDKTLKRHHSALSQFFRFGMDRGLLTNGHRKELVEDFRFRPNKAAREQRDAWTSDELKTLFASPVWTGCAGPRARHVPGDMVIKDARFWLPLLALFHGARLEELADLYRRDVWQDGDVWALRIVETEGEGEGPERRLKTEHATRTLPLHPMLIRLGFLDYIAETAPEPNDPLFPDLEPQGPDKKRGPRITRWFVHYRRKVGVYRAGVAMHAFRHTARTRLSDLTNGLRERHLNSLFGHSGGGSEGAVRYDKGAGLAAIAETLALLEYPEIDLSRLTA